MTTLSYQFTKGPWTGKSTFPTGIFINNEFVESDSTIDVVNPSTGQLITKISEAKPEHVDIAVKAAQHAFDTTWGLNASGETRQQLLYDLATLMERDADELAALEALDNGKTFSWARGTDVASSISTIKYYAGWASKITGSTIETDERKFAYVRKEPKGPIGAILPWNFLSFLQSLSLSSHAATATAHDGLENWPCAGRGMYRAAQAV
uniref:Aldehyde dehydrogenase domain-containing protein n=1 Tax=Mycena chlorophos TaxID=658473 RepID=A0ABQ0L9Z2_MYCCL|nr:predicted protein [Mycena chlorophos]